MDIKNKHYFTTIKSYTSIEQSRKLAEILPLESADMSYLSEESLTPKVNYYGMVFFNSEEEKPSALIPCWSLAALLDVLPDIDNYYLVLDKEDKEYCCCYENYNGESFRHCFSDNPVDACVAMIERLHELNLL